MSNLVFTNENVNVTVVLEDLVVIQNDSQERIKCSSKSELFRNLYELGMEISEISKLVSSHYSFVHGVISKSCEMRVTKKDSKSDLIRNLAEQGFTPGEISKQLNSNYSFVFSVVKKYKATKNEDEQTIAQ